MKTRSKTLQVRFVRVVTGGLLGLILFIILLTLLQVSSEAVMSAAPAPNDVAQTSRDHADRGSTLLRSMGPAVDQPDATVFGAAHIARDRARVAEVPSARSGLPSAQPTAAEGTNEAGSLATEVLQPSTHPHRAPAPAAPPPGELARQLDTNVCGTIDTDTTWTVAGSPYILTCDVVVATGVTLIIEPGVVVMGQNWTELWVRGHLQAVGSVTQPITFTSVPNNGVYQWGGLVFDGGTGHLRHATVRYAGQYNGIMPANIIARNVVTGEVRIESSRVISESRSNYTDFGLAIENSHVVVSDTLYTQNGNDSSDYALQVTGASSVVTVTGSIFQDNAGFGVHASNGAVVTVTDSTIHGNGNVGMVPWVVISARYLWVAWCSTR